MKLTVVHQESYSRTELILRTLFGAFYIVLSHVYFILSDHLGRHFSLCCILGGFIIWTLSGLFFSLNSLKFLKLNPYGGI